jgi:hypothetical protein
MKSGETTRELPADVRDAVHANRKIEAIKLLREQQSLGLKEAKEIVDAYIDENRHVIGDQRSSRESGIGNRAYFGDRHCGRHHLRRVSSVIIVQRRSSELSG